MAVANEIDTLSRYRATKTSRQFAGTAAAEIDPSAKRYRLHWRTATARALAISSVMRLPLGGVSLHASMPCRQIKPHRFSEKHTRKTAAVIEIPTK